ncbi:MAG: hypothetical protein ACLS6G_08305 [Christensenellales bacterium]
MSVKHGANLVKFFPAGMMGGVNATNAQRLLHSEVIPTNGVRFPTLSEYAATHVAAWCSTYPCPNELIPTEIDEISRLKKR